ncbi:MAG: purine-nucleoside phosphorylase [Acutalibacteraceae bacterium]
MKNYPTPHINATPQDFAKTVLMPGDPLRAKFIAENFLKDAKLVNNVRGVQGYTGYYNGTRISVMASGMGMPSIGIYSYELYNFFGVDNIIRVGSAGGMNTCVKVRDIVIAQGACTNSNFPESFGIKGTFAPIASYEMLEKSVETAREMNLSFKVGNVLSSDVFYNDDTTFLPKEQQSSNTFAKMGVLAVEMEAAALYMNAARANKNALAILTISDHLLTGESTSAEERQNSFTDMMKLSLETAVKMESGK